MKKLMTVCICAALFMTACSQDTDPNVLPPAEPAPTAPPTEVQTPSMPVSNALPHLEAPPQWAVSAAGSDQLSCFLDVIQGKGPGPGKGETLVSGETQLLGWSVDKARPKGVPQKDAIVRLTAKVGGKLYYFPATRSPRPDVEAAAEFAPIATTNSGVVSDAALAGVEPGAYEVAFIVGDETAASTCSFGEGRIVVVQ